AVLELVIWRVPTPVEGSAHGYKYRLFYGREGKRIVGFDNERGKGDHRHLDGVETAYTFTTVEAVVRDFLAEVEKRRTI
ncbi:MAG: toxin-antitoxin system TumE family protein, partial [Caulobacteraceae bacterium]